MKTRSLVSLLLFNMVLEVVQSFTKQNYTYKGEDKIIIICRWSNYLPRKKRESTENVFK